MHVAPYLETEQFPRGSRVLLALPACLLLIGPYGAFLGDSPDNPFVYAILAVALAAGALLIGLAIAQPRRRVTIDGESRTIAIAQTAPLPRFRQDRAERSFDDVVGTRIEAAAAGDRPGRGFHPVLELGSGDRIVLRAQSSEEGAQEVIDHLVLLGLPGRHSAADAGAQLSAEPPTTWL